MSFRFKKPVLHRGAATMALVSMVALSACDESITLAPGAVDPKDSCSPFQQSIVDARQKANNLKVQNAALGALAGAAIGAAVTGDGEGALIGALIGGAVSGVATAETQKKQRATDAETLRNVNAQAGSATQLLTQAGKSSAGLRSCRQKQIKALQQKVRAGSISNQAARAELTVLKRRASVDNQIISASFNGIGNRVDDFVRTGAQAGGVEQAIISRQAAATTQQQRTARAATPNVSRAKSTQAQLVQADARSRESIDRSLDAIDVLLSG